MRGGLAILTGLASCKNFLNAGKVSDEIKEAIAYANAKSCTVIVQSDSKLGTFLSSGEKECKVGYSINLQFTVNADDYIFNGLKAVSSKDNSVSRDEYVEFTVTPLEEKQNTYVITVKLLKPASDILIIPDCTLIPRIVDFYPPFVPTGYDQDTTISITFSKPMDVSSFGDFSSIVITSKDGQDRSDFYDTPYFTNDNKVLNIPTKKDKFILALDGNIDYADMSFSILSNNIKDVDDLVLRQSEAVEFRLNKNVDNVSPVLTDIHLYSSNDKSEYFYKELSSAEFDSWTDTVQIREDGTTEFLHGTFSQNHVSELYITASGYDTQSGIKGFLVQETYLQTTKGEKADEITRRHENQNYVLDSKIDDSGRTIKSVAINYNFITPEDGLILVELFFIDNAENKSQIQKFYVIKDSVAIYNFSRFSAFFEEFDVAKLYQVHDENGYTPFPLIKSGLIGSDTYWMSYGSARTISLELSDENNNVDVIIKDLDIGNSTSFADFKDQINETLATTYFNPEESHILKFIFTDESGLSGYIECPIVKCARVVDVDAEKLSLIMSYDKVDEKFKDFSIGRAWYYTFNDETSLSEGIFTGSFPRGNGIYHLYIYQTVKMSVSGVRKFSINLPFGKGYIHDTSHPEGNTPADFPGFPDIILPNTTDGESNDVEYDLQTGKARLTINVTSTNNLQTYNLIISNPSAGKNTYPQNTPIEIDNGYDYEVYLTALDNEGNLLAKSFPKTLSLKNIDNIAPELVSRNIEPRKSYYDPSVIRCTKVPYDYDSERNKLYNISTVDCYFVPTKYGISLTKEEFFSYDFKKVAVTLDDGYENDGFFDIPVDGLGDGSYYLYYYLEDDSEYGINGALYNSFYSMIYSFADVQPEFSVNNNLITIKAISYYKINPKYSGSISGPYYFLGTDYMEMNFLDTENKKWNHAEPIKLEPSNSTSTADRTLEYPFDENYSNTFVKICGIFSGSGGGINGSVYDNVYMKPIYVYPDYYRYKGTDDEITCHSTSWLKVQNGYQVFCDAPCFVHTMYCSKKLTETNTPEDALQWEIRTMETGIEFSDGTPFTYKDTNLAKIPEGYWYTTIIHFADGTVIMGEVTQM